MNFIGDVPFYELVDDERMHIPSWHQVAGDLDLPMQMHTPFLVNDFKCPFRWINVPYNTTTGTYNWTKVEEAAMGRYWMFLEWGKIDLDRAEYFSRRGERFKDRITANEGVLIEINIRKDPHTGKKTIEELRCPRITQMVMWYRDEDFEYRCMHFHEYSIKTTLEHVWANHALNELETFLDITKYGYEVV